jgi:hypothetical protein
VKRVKLVKEVAETIPFKGSDSYGLFSYLSDESFDNSKSFSLSFFDFLPECEVWHGLGRL